MNNVTNFQATKKIAKDLLIACNDYKYLSLPTNDMIKAAVIDQNQAFFVRLKYFIFYFMVIELHKIFSGNENYNIRKHINQNIINVEGNITAAQIEELKQIRKSINHEENATIILKIKNLRNQFYAHLDESREFNDSTDLSFEEIEILLNKLIEYLSILNPIFENCPLDLEVNNEILRYNLYRYFAQYMIPKKL